MFDSAESRFLKCTSSSVIMESVNVKFYDNFWMFFVLIK